MLEIISRGLFPPPVRNSREEKNVFNTKQWHVYHSHIRESFPHATARSHVYVFFNDKTKKVCVYIYMMCGPHAVCYFPLQLRSHSLCVCTLYVCLCKITSTLPHLVSHSKQKVSRKHSKLTLLMPFILAHTNQLSTFKHYKLHSKFM